MDHPARANFKACNLILDYALGAAIVALALLCRRKISLSVLSEKNCGGCGGSGRPMVV